LVRVQEFAYVSSFAVLGGPAKERRFAPFLTVYRKGATGGKWRCSGLLSVSTLENAN
jgi:hypothetical protein